MNAGLAAGLFGVVSLLALATAGAQTADRGQPANSAGAAPARASETQAQTFVYKKAGDLEIKLDVYRAADSVPRPVVVWIHGGALINGGREGGGGRVKEMMLSAGYAVVSIDYRLAPETKLPGIVEDVEDAFRWIRREGPQRFHADVSRIAVVGGSAGGHLALTAGFRVKPPPDAVVSFWGYGDLAGPWLSQPSPHARHKSASLTDAEAARIAGGPAVANAKERAGDGGAFYQHCRREGIWTKMVSGHDPLLEPERLAPYMAVKNVTADYPPTMLIHGTEDTDVPFEQSELMAAEFRRHGVPHQFVRIERAEHGLSGADPADIERAYAAALTFVKTHLSD